MTFQDNPNPRSVASNAVCQRGSVSLSLLCLPYCPFWSKLLGTFIPLALSHLITLQDILRTTNWVYECVTGGCLLLVNENLFLRLCVEVINAREYVTDFGLL